MSTVAPIEVEKYLLQGESGDEDLLGAAGLKRAPGAAPVKPPLEDALLNSYNKSAPTALRPGELPPPVELAPETVQAGKTTLQKAGETISSAAGTAARIPGQIYESLPSFGGGAQPQAPGGVRPEPGTVAAPAPQREYSPGFYGTLQRHANFVRDVAEFGGKTLAGMGAFAFGAATAVSDILNAQLARVAGGGPSAGGPESSTHYRDIFTRMDKTISDLTPEPRSDTAKTLSKGVGAVTGLIKDISELPGKGLVAAGILNEDTARVLSFGAELYLFYKIDRAVRQAAPELRSKIAEFKTRMSKAKTDSEVADIANDLANAASKNPRLEAALDEARGKFRDEADREAGAAGPREPSPEGGPAGGGAAIDFEADAAALRTYNESLRQRVEELRTERPEMFEKGADIAALRTELDKVPKPQPRGQQPVTTMEAMEARLGEQPQPQAAPAPEAPRAQAAPTAERPVQPEVVVGQETAVAQAPRPAAETPVATAPTPQAPRQSDADLRTYIEQKIAPIGSTFEELASFMIGEIRRGTRPEELYKSYMGRLVPEGIAREIAPAMYELYSRAKTQSTLAGRVAPQAPAPVPPVAAAATVAPETVPAPVSPETPAVAAVPRGRVKPQLTPEQAIGLNAELQGFLRTKEEPAVPSSRQGYFGWEGTHTAESAIARAQELGVLNTIRTELSQGVSLADVAGIARQKASGRIQRGEIYAVVEAIKNSPEAALAPLREMLSTGKLAELKSLARDAADGGNLITGVVRLGFQREEARAIAEQLRKVRAKKAEAASAAKPAVQTAATEAVLENAPAGTEVEIPAPTEPVVDTSPVVEKPKRKRRVVKAPDETTTVETAPRIPADLIQYHNITDISTLRNAVGVQPDTPGVTNIPQAPVYLRAKQGEKPDAIFIDTTGLNTRTSLADIQVQTERGSMSTELSAVMQANLARQAQLSGRPLAEAHQFTGQELMREATRIAAENDLDLYVKKGKNYELVPKDVVRTDARLNRGDDLAPTPISAEAAGAYAESKTSDIGPAQIRAILAAVERGEDISAQLPSELVPHYQAMRDNERAGIDTSERRAFIDMLTDLYQISRDILENESGAVNIYAARMAAQRLQADMRKAGKTVREFLFGARPEDVAMFEAYLDRISNPAPPDSTNPRNMRFDPENIIPGDRVVKQRVISSTAGTNAVPLWQSEVRGIQGARDIKPGGTAWDVKLPLRQHKAAGTEFLYYAYRTAQKNLNAELNDLHAGMEELSRGFSSRSLENIGANGYQRQGGDGQRILTYNKVAPRPMTTAERRLQATIDGIYADLFNRINETRVATGREPLPRVDDYQTFARTISLLNRLGIQVDLARDTVAEVNAKYAHHKATNFPYIVRKHAFYTAEMNALKILDTYAQAALKDIHMSPFLAKMHELIETKLPDPVTGKETWSLKDNKPGLYNELRRWTDYLATGTNLDIPATQRIILQTLNSNIAYATLSYLIRSAGIQVSTLVNTNQALGTTATAKAIFANLADHLTGGKQRQFALDNSEILSSRKFIDAYNQVAGAIIGRRPRDFFHAVRTGALSDIQKVVGNPGFKLLELFDMEAAVMSWNAAYKQARGRAMNYSHKDAVRFADDLVVRTQGSTMPGDLAGVQRNALGKLVTQFQTFLISDWNFLTNEVLTKGKIGGGGGGQIPPGGVASGSGSWETGGPRGNFQMAKNIIKFLIATQLVNEFYKLLHIQPAQPDPVEDVRKGIKEQHGPLMLAWDIAVGQAERLPFVGGMRYGKGITGPAIETARDLARSYRGDPLSPPWWEPTATITGVPGVRQLSKTIRAGKRGESGYDSLVGWYSQEGRAGRERPERRERARRQ